MDERFNTAPGWMKGDALREWERLVSDLGQAGLLAVTDPGVLALYCSVSAEIAKHGRKGWSIAAPLVAQMRALAVDLGLTARSRERLLALVKSERK